MQASNSHSICWHNFSGCVNSNLLGIARGMWIRGGECKPNLLTALISLSGWCNCSSVGDEKDVLALIKTSASYIQSIRGSRHLHANITFHCLRLLLNVPFPIIISFYNSKFKQQLFRLAVGSRVLKISSFVGKRTDHFCQIKKGSCHDSSKTTGDRADFSN